MMHGQTQMKSYDYLLVSGLKVLWPIDCAFLSDLWGIFFFAFNCSLAIVSVFHYLIAFWFRSYTIGTASVLFQAVIIFVTLLSLSSYDSRKWWQPRLSSKRIKLCRIFLFLSVLCFLCTWPGTVQNLNYLSPLKEYDGDLFQVVIGQTPTTFRRLDLFMSSGAKRRVRNFVWGAY